MKLHPELPLRTDSLRTTLIIWILVPSLCLWGGASWFIVSTTRHSAASSYDRILQSFLEMLAYRVHLEDGKLAVDFPTDIIPVLRERHIDKRFFQILGPNGELIAGDPTLPAPPGYPERATLFDSTIDGKPVRIAARRINVPGTSGSVYLQVAETMAGRYRGATEMISKLVAGGVVVFLLIILKTVLAVSRVLAPLIHVQRELAEASLDNVATIDAATAPREIRPLVLAINHLLERLRADIQKQKRFLSNAAHQLRTPIAGMKIHAELALREKCTPPVQQAITEIQHSLDGAANLTNKMLTLASAEPGVFHKKGSHPCNLNALVRGVCKKMAPHAARRNIDLGLDEIADGIQVNAQEWAIEELISNLLDNALTYTPGGGIVTVTVAEDAGAPILQVEDTGPGIPPEERSKIFERFYRLPNSPMGGTGLGLSIVSEISHSLGATVDILDPLGGKGTIFQITFPRLAAEPAPHNTSCVDSSADPTLLTVG